MLTLGIETTCDETGIALVQGLDHILINLIESQIPDHQLFGGVIPELASRRHQALFCPLLLQAFASLGMDPSQLDAIAVAHGPGLIGSLRIGLCAAHTLATLFQCPLYGVNHIEAHLYAACMERLDQVSFPAIGVVLSGGHTNLVLMQDFATFQTLGQTQDDALGEAFDKVAKLLGHPYPGGPIIEQLALHGDPNAYTFASGQVKGAPLDFSFSGIKTKVLYTLYGQNQQKTIPSFSMQTQRDIAYAFQEAVLNDVVKKILLASKKTKTSTVILGGGVTHNQRLRTKLAQTPLRVFFPQGNLSLDNGAMIAGLNAWQRVHHKGLYKDPISPQSRIHWD